MAAENFELRVDPNDATRRQVWLRADADLDYETIANRAQRVWLEAQRAEDSTDMAAGPLLLGILLNVTDVEEKPRWTAPFRTFRIDVPADLSSNSITIDLAGFANDPEGNFFEIRLGTVPSQLTAAFGTGANVNRLTVTLLPLAANPSADLTLNIPVFLWQSDAKVAGSDRNLVVQIDRYDPAGIYSSYPHATHPGVVHIDPSPANHFTLNVSHLLQNSDSRTVTADFNSDDATTFSGTYANYTLTQNASGDWIFRGDRHTPWVFTGSQQETFAIRFQTHDNGDTSTALMYWRVVVEG